LVQTHSIEDLKIQRATYFLRYYSFRLCQIWNE